VTNLIKEYENASLTPNYIYYYISSVSFYKENYKLALTYASKIFEFHPHISLLLAKCHYRLSNFEGLKNIVIANEIHYVDFKVSEPVLMDPIQAIMRQTNYEILFFDGMLDFHKKDYINARSKMKEAMLHARRMSKALLKYKKTNFDLKMDLDYVDNVMKYINLSELFEAQFKIMMEEPNKPDEKKDQHKRVKNNPDLSSKSKRLKHFNMAIIYLEKNIWDKAFRDLILLLADFEKVKTTDLSNDDYNDYNDLKLQIMINGLPDKKIAKLLAKAKFY
jgi:hypothetical protein